MAIIIAIILFFIPLAAKLYVDFNQWRKNQSVDHVREWKWVAGFEMGTAGIFFIVGTNSKNPTDGVDFAFLMLTIAVTALMISSWFWLLFDGLYNLIRKRYAKKHRWMLIVGQYDFWYTGSNDKDDAATDNLLQRLKPWKHKAVKIGAIILFTGLYVICAT